MQKKLFCKKSNQRSTAKDLDQFYTNPVIAQSCYNQVKNKLNLKNFDLYLEPSAGTGSFFKILPRSKRLGLDLDPKSKYIKKQDFFSYYPQKIIKRKIKSKFKIKKYPKNILVIGNPPFGKNASLAIKFFNHAAMFAKVIAFIAPKTFKKTSIQNKLNLNFHLLHEEDLPKNSFIYNNIPYDVPCCFQIWIKQKNQREKKIINIDNDIFEFVKNKKNADFAVRRVGGTTGKCKNLNDAAEVSHYFIKIKNNKISAEKLIKYINNLDFKKICNSTAGVKSLSKPEFVEIFFNNFDIKEVI